MELLIPGIWVIIGAVAVVFGIIPRLGPMLVLIVAAVLLGLGIYHHHALFRTEYRLATWSDKLRTYGPAVMISVMVVFILGFIFTLFGGASVPIPNLASESPEESPATPEESPATQKESPVESIVNAAKNALEEGVNAVKNVAEQATNYVRRNESNGNRVRFNTSENYSREGNRNRNLYNNNRNNRSRSNNNENNLTRFSDI